MSVGGGAVGVADGRLTMAKEAVVGVGSGVPQAVSRKIISRVSMSRVVVLVVTGLQFLSKEVFKAGKHQVADEQDDS